MDGLSLPFKVKGIRQADDPFYAVSNGCLLKSMASENKKAEKIVDNMGVKEEKVQTEVIKNRKIKIKR